VVPVQSSPFVVTGVVDPDEVIGRHDALAALRDRAAKGRYVLLVAPRRYGKTSLVHRLRRDADLTRDLSVVIVDLMGVQTLDDIAVRLAQAWTRLPQGPLAKAAAAVLPYIGGLDVGGGVVGIRLRPPSAGPSSATLEAVLDIPRAVAERTGRRVLVVLDEFQAISSVAHADAVIRSQIQHQSASVSYLFSGSERSTLHMLFQERARPLYGQAEQIPLGPFDPQDLGTYVDDRLVATGRQITGPALTAYLAFVAGHPQRSMLVADCMWATVDDGGVIDRPHVGAAVDRALERCEAEFDSAYDLLTDTQVRVLRLLAWDEPLTGAAARRLSVSQGSTRSAADTLVDRGLLHVDGRRHRITDPLFAEWIRRITTSP
jgi:hypothetical protein